MAETLDRGALKLGRTYKDTVSGNKVLITDIKKSKTGLKVTGKYYDPLQSGFIMIDIKDGQLQIVVDDVDGF